MKNNKNIFLYLILFFFSLTQSLIADEFDITAKNIKLFQNNEKILAEGNVHIISQDGIIIEAESATYDKKENIIKAEKFVKIINTQSNDKLASDKILYLKNKDQILAEGNVIFEGSNGVTIKTESATYDNRSQVVKSNQLTKLDDGSGNLIVLDMFNYSTKNKSLRSKGNIEMTDKLENKYFFDDIFIDVEKKRMAGSDVKIKFNKNTFGNVENDPRLIANSAVVTENKSYIEGGVFTTCKKEVINALHGN